MKSSSDRYSHRVRSAAACTVLAGLAACGGGGDGNEPPTPPAPVQHVIPEGIWLGNSTTNRTVSLLMWASGNFYLTYSAVGDPNVVTGFTQGTGTAEDSAFTSSSGVDFNTETNTINLGPRVTGNFALRQTFTGALSLIPGRPPDLSFATAFSNTSDQAPSLANLATTYTGQVTTMSGPRNATLTITTLGSFSGTDALGCTFTGTVTPRSRGNAYDMAWTQGGAPCALALRSFSGIAYADSAARRLYILGTDGAATPLPIWFSGLH